MVPPGATNDLLLPGVQPPLSHFGATLLRHVVVTGLRYTLYHLGLPLPDKAPLRIDRLRLYFDTRALAGLLDETPRRARGARGIGGPRRHGGRRRVRTQRGGVLPSATVALGAPPRAARDRPSGR